MKLTKNEAEKKLYETFRIEHFYDEQWDAVKRILDGERVLMIQKTGFGKSLCYQFPATLFDGITVIFSPLIALMRDQVRKLNELGISARYINSEQSHEENTMNIQDAIDGKIKILYIAPERQENQQWIEATRKMKLSMVVVDEAHTISVWGHDFRPAFRRIINLVKLLPSHLPVLATTATATERVQNDIERQIGGNITTVIGSLNRPNFKLYVIKVKSEDEKMIWLAQNLNDIEGTGLIYTGTRVNTEIYAKWLRYCDIDAVDYNAGLDAETRKQIEEDLMTNSHKCFVSTNALGMGIDKADIRFIIHTQMPASPIHYYQEIGRAGRDGKPTIILLFYNETMNDGGIEEDFTLPKSFIENGRPDTIFYHKVVEYLKEEPLSEHQLMKSCNLKQTQFRVIKADLIDQGIIKEVLYNRSKKYEYQYNATPLDTNSFENLRDAKMRDLWAMRSYVYTNKPRMQFLCEFLDDKSEVKYKNCDNSNLDPLTIDVNDYWKDKISEFRETYFPVLNVIETTSKKMKDDVKWSVNVPAYNQIDIYKNDILFKSYINCINWNDFSVEEQNHIRLMIESHRNKKSHIINGVAASYYGVSNVGNAIHRSKYENGGDFPDFLLKLTLKAFRKTFKNQKFDLILYVPPTSSGDLVKNFAIKMASVLKIDIGHNLIKNRTTEEQKIFQNAYSKRDNVADAFDYELVSEIRGKKILLIDDIFDSGATVKEIGKMLTSYGAELIAPITIAKTVGGELA